jgi:nudix-type nucleoside diphosphatase (YffH/AdpP family)
MNVEIIHTEKVFDGFFKIDKATLKHEKFNGEWTGEITRLNFERGDAVAAIVYNTDSQEVILINQFRYPTYSKTGGWITEVIAGMIDDGETYVDALHREVREETGYELTHVEKIASFYVSPGGSSERIFLYYAETDNQSKKMKGGGLANENEDIQLVMLSLQQLQKALADNEINDAKTIIACYYLLNKAIV